MKILPEPRSFQWDKGNIDKNFRKHRVSIQEAEEMFSTDPFIVSNDVVHSTSGEQRFRGLGKTKDERKLFVAFTIRNNQIRVISVRDMHKNEEKVYENFEKNTRF